MTNLYRAIGKSMLARYAVYGANLLSLVVLTRLYTPEVFGIVAAVLTVVTLLQLVAEGGISPAIINLSAWKPAERDGVFGLSVLASLILALGMLIFSHAISQFFGIAQISEIAIYMAITLFLNTSAALPLALLQRQQHFFQISKAGIFAEVVALSASLAAHQRFAPLHSYAIYFSVKSASNFLLLWVYSGGTEFGRPIPGANFSAIRPMLRTTGFQLAFNFVNYFSRNLDNILVGKILGPVPLGVYDRSYQLMRYPLQLLTFAMTPAIQPVIRSISHDPDAVNKLHRDLAFKLSIMGSIAAIGTFALAKPIVLIVLGDQWLKVVPVVRLLAMIIPVQIILSTSGSFFQSFNRTDLLFYCGIFAAIANAIAMMLGLMHGGLESLCWALFFSFHLCFLQAYWVLHRYVFGGGFLKFLFKSWPFAATAILLALLAANTEILHA